MVTGMDVQIRTVAARDHGSVLQLAPRLLIGVDPSRPPDHVWEAVQGWVKDSLAAAGTDRHDGWVAVVDEAVVGFVSVAEEKHWSGETDAWIGELVVDERHEGRGVGRALLATVEQWATEHGLRHVRLSTGAANQGARAFYEKVGYQLSEVTLTKRI